MCRGNRNDFYSTARLNGCMGYLLDKECYSLSAVLLTQFQYRSLSCSRRLLPIVADCCRLLPIVADVWEPGFKSDTITRTK